MQSRERSGSSIVALNREYILRVNPGEQGVTGEIILRDREGEGEGNCVFTAPLRNNVDELVAWSKLALKAYKES